VAEDRINPEYVATLRILLVNKFYDHRGGTERILFDLEAELRADGHDVAVFATRDERNLPTPWREYFAAGRDYENPTLGQRLSYAVATVYDRQARQSLARLLDEFRPDVVHLHNIYHQLSPSVLDELRERGLPAVMTLHDYKLACPVYRLFRQGRICEECVGRSVPWGSAVHGCSRGSRLESVLLSVESTVHRLRRSYERAVHRFVCPSRFLAGVMQRQGIPAEQLTVIENAPRDLPSSEDLPPRDPTPTVLLATRLSEEKGVEVLLEAAQDVGEVSVRVAGTGPLEADLRRCYPETPQRQWLGRLDQSALARERARSWAVAVPSLWYENAPLSAIESFHAGRPVLGADHGGLVEMVEEGVTGWRAPPGDVGAWVELLRRVVSRPEELECMGEAASRCARERYDFARFYDEHLALYQEVIEGS
jgi:glycosyltransferase involved in cell wall biosynthesis